MFVKITYWFFLSVLFTLDLNAQVYYFKKYSTSDGLIQGTVKAISQDSFGRMWFGTAEGVSIYDGSDFHNFGFNEGITLPVITCFLEVSPGTMLVGTIGSGIIVIEKPQFKNDFVKAVLQDTQYVVNPYISSIIRGPDGDIWISTDDGLTRWKMKNEKLAEIKHIKEFGSFGKLSINQITFDKDGVMYLAAERGLVVNKDSQYILINSETIKYNPPVLRVYCDFINRVWFSTPNRLYYMDGNNIVDFTGFHPEINSPVISFMNDENGYLLFGGYGRIYKTDGNSFNIIDEKNGLTEKSIVCLFTDRENNLWIGSLEGISKLTKRNLKFVKSKDPLLRYGKIKKLGNKLVIGTSKGLYEINNYSLNPSSLDDGIPQLLVRDVLFLNDTVWFTTSEGLYYKHGNSINRLTVEDGLPSNIVYELAADKSGTVWVGTQSGVAYIKKRKLYNFINQTEQSWFYSDEECKITLSKVSIRKIFVDKKNNVWIGSWDKGLIKINKDSVYRYTEKEGLLDLHIRGIDFDKRNDLWIGTRYAGAFKFDGNKFSQFSTRDGLSSNWIFSTVEDDDGNFWFSTANGISKYDGNKFISFGSSEGIKSAELSNLTDYKNELWFNSSSEIYSYKIPHDTAVIVSPKILFRDIHLLDGELPSAGEINANDSVPLTTNLLPLTVKNKTFEFEYSGNTIFFDFAGMSFRDEQQMRYNYKLEGFDKDWILSTKRNYTSYTHLPSGNYEFIVYAINSDGIRSSAPASFSFEILPPFWQTWWFISLTVFSTLLLTSIVTILVYRSRINQKLKVERLRTKISSDLHDEIGTSLSSIAIFSELIKRDAENNSSKSREMLEKIENTSRNLIDKMGDIVWAINPQNDRLEDAILKLREYSVRLLESRGIDVKINIPEEVFNITLTMDVRSNLLMIFKEIVTNAAKYSFAKTIDINFSISIKNGRKTLVLNVKDDGVGFNTSEVKSGNGLRNIIRRAKDINAIYNLESSPRKGTIVNLEITLE